MDKILCCDHSNETSLPVLSNGAICFQNFRKRNLGIFVEFCPWPHLAVKGLMLISRVCLGINVFNVNIERKGKEKAWQAFQQLGSGMLNFPVSTLLFFSCLSFLWPFLRFIAKCYALTRMRNCSVADSLFSPAFHLLFIHLP